MDCRPAAAVSLSYQDSSSSLDLQCWAWRTAHSVLRWAHSAPQWECLARQWAFGPVRLGLRWDSPMVQLAWLKNWGWLRWGYLWSPESCSVDSFCSASWDCWSVPFHGPCRCLRACLTARTPSSRTAAPCLPKDLVSASCFSPLIRNRNGYVYCDGKPKTGDACLTMPKSRVTNLPRVGTNGRVSCKGRRLQWFLTLRC